MKIGIILYSETGNTLYVAKKLKESFDNAGHLCEINQIIQIKENNNDPKKIKIDSMPDLTTYDVLVFASPVQAFTLAAVFKEYLKNIEPIKEKNVLLYVTKSLRTKGFGGNKSINIMKDVITSKGGIIKNSGMVFWKKEEERTAQIKKLIQDFTNYIDMLN